jgi:ABC-type Na+ efflux pump permease subunit
MATARHFTKLPYRRPSQEIEMEGASNASGSSGSHGGSDVEDSIDVSAELTNMSLAARNGSPSSVRKQSSSFLSATAASAVGARHEDSLEDTESRVQRTASGTDETTDEGSCRSSFLVVFFFFFFFHMVADTYAT